MIRSTDTTPTTKSKYNLFPDLTPAEYEALKTSIADRGVDISIIVDDEGFQTPTEKKHWQVGGVWLAPWRLADDYHVYGLQWEKEELKWFVDGVLVRSVENTHWHQPLFLIFDSETMPDWFGMPRDEDLPSTFGVEYVRAWRRK